MICASSGVEQPQVTTLFALLSTVDYAVVVEPNCKERALAQLRLRSLTIQSEGIEAVESYPSATRLVLEGNVIRSFKAVGSSVQTLDLSSNGITTLTGFTFPQSVTELLLDGNTIEQFSAANFPSQLKTLSLRQTELQSLAGLRFPESLTTLSMDTSSKLRDLTGLVLPPQLQKFSVAQSPVRSVSGVRFPSTLTTLSIGGTIPITVFDVHTADLPILEAAQLSIAGGTSISKCSNSHGQLTKVKSKWTVCVYDDDAFGKPDTSNTGGGSSGKESSGSAADGPNDSSSDTTGSSSSTSGWSSTGSKQPPSQGSSLTASSSSNAKNDSPTTGVSSDADSDSGNSWSTYALVIALIITLIIGLIVSIVLRKKRSAKDADDSIPTTEYSTTIDTTKNQTASASDPGTSSLTASSSMQSLTYDIRDDPLIIARRVMNEDLRLTRKIGQGGFGVVYRAKLHDRDVVIKRLVNTNRQHHGHAYNSVALRRFMDEIRLSAVVEHPTIVAFVGVAWTTLLDLSLILEYLPNGDLYGHLRRHKQQLTWLEDGDSDHYNSHGRLRLRSKAALAIDIVDALVYLHAWSPLPIVHRDLKARNVLLSSEFRAKLCDFGVSREAMLSETMTGGVGTTAWIAPEVLQGERYSEKADIYSLGMVLCEMDVCGHPYNHDVSVQEEMADAQIACLVSAGQLRPTVGADCPAVVRQLIMQCVEYEAARRPSAREVLTILEGAVQR